MALSETRIQELKAEKVEDLFLRACGIHSRLRENLLADPEVIDTCLRQEARDLHEFFYSCVPAGQFERYVSCVHGFLNNHRWLEGWLGVPYTYL